MLWLHSTFITFSALQIVSAQSDASCLPFYSWTFNSHKKSPCEVASSLLAVCNNAPFPVDALPTASHYVGPTLQNANPCQCNTVVYSLMSACGACQGRTYLSWSVWSANCPMVSIDSYPEPIPSGIAVPGWAYLDVEATDNFDQSNAKDNANITESTAIPVPTSSAIKTQSPPVVKATTSATTTVASSPTASTDESSSSTLSDSRVNAVGGGVVGGLAGLALILGLVFFLIHRRKQRAKRGEHLTSPSVSQGGAWQASGQGPYMTQVAGSQNPGIPSLNSNASPAAYHFDSSVSGSADSMPMGHSHV